MLPLLVIDADSLFYDAYSIPDNTRTGYGFSAVKQYGQSCVPTEINDDILRKGLARVRTRILEMRDRFYGPELKIAVGGNNNFRYDIYPDYKKDRSTAKTLLNTLAKETILLAIEAGWAEPAHGAEADDMARSACWEAEQMGRPYVVAHLDKDLDCIPGRHFNYRKNVLYEVSPEAGQRHFFKQLIIGDGVDNIPGAKGIGEVKSKRYIGDAVTLEDFQEGTVEAYMQSYGDDWYENLQLNGKLIHMLRWPGDYFSCDDWPVVQALR